jgi:hypothetical protein
MLACNLSIYVYTFPYNWFVPLKKKKTQQQLCGGGAGAAVVLLFFAI